MVGGRRRLSHGGAVSGYTTTNQVYPDDRAAIVVFTNIYSGGAGASGQIASRVAAIIFSSSDTADVARARSGAKGVRRPGPRPNRPQSFTSNANAFFTDQVLADYGASLGHWGRRPSSRPTGSQLRGGLRIRSYRIRAGSMTVDLTTMTQPDGRIEQYIVEREG
jgi:hypothetical protein